MVKSFYRIKAPHLNNGNPALKEHEGVRYCMSKFNYTSYLIFIPEGRA